MTEYTFNIADYRPLLADRPQRIQELGSVGKDPNGFVVLTSNARAREESWTETRPAVVDIRSLREAHRATQASCHSGAYPRRNKILHFTNFTNEVPEHVITMARPDSAPRSDSGLDEDPDPTNLPPAA
jgi:hypothetical protein